MNKRILFIVLQLICFSITKAQEEIEAPKTQEMKLRVPEEEPLPYIWNYTPSIITAKKKVLSEIDMTVPANRVLDSVFYRRRRPGSFFDIVFDMLRQGKVRAYPVLADTVVLPLKSIRKMLDSAGYISTEKIIVSEEWLYDNSNLRTVVKLVWLAFVTKVDDKTYKPVIWVLYPYIRDELKKYKVVTYEDGKLRLNVFLEGKFFKSNVIGELH